MPDTILFSWDDGVQDIWETTNWTPAVEPVRDMPGQVVKLLSGSRMLVTQLTDAGTPLIMEGVRLTWEDAPPDLCPIVEATYAAGRQVTVVYPWRGATATITGYIPPNGKDEREVEYKTRRLEITVLEL